MNIKEILGAASDQIERLLTPKDQRRVLEYDLMRRRMAQAEEIKTPERHQVDSLEKKT